MSESDARAAGIACGALGADLRRIASRRQLGLKRIQARHCDEMLAPEEVKAALAEQPGTYFLTDFLARTFEHTVVRELGPDRHPELRENYFRTYTRVLWLAQLVA